jgi:hypothetical protein
MPLYTRKRVVLCKRETTYGTDPVPTAGTDALLLRSVEIEPLDQEYAERTLVRPYYGNFEDLPIRSRMKLTKELELAGFGSAGPTTPTPGYSALLRSAGLAQSVTLGVNVIYTPVSQNFDSVTDYFHNDLTLHKLLGGRSELEISLALNEVPVYRVMTTGLYGGVVDAALPTPTVSAYQRPVVVNQINTTDLNIHGLTTAELKNFSMSMGNVLVHRNLVGAAENIDLTGRLVTGEIEIQANTVAVKDWWSSIRGATLGAFSITHGPALNRVKIDAANVQLTNPRFSDVDGITHLTLGMKFMPAAGNDEFSITVL